MQHHAGLRVVCMSGHMQAPSAIKCFEVSKDHMKYPMSDSRSHSWGAGSELQGGPESIDEVWAKKKTLIDWLVKTYVRIHSLSVF